MEREYKNGDKVIAGYQKLKMMVVDAVECLKGWRYQLCFTKKDGTPDKRPQPSFFLCR